jgi:hypothetical protein
MRKSVNLAFQNNDLNLIPVGYLLFFKEKPLFRPYAPTCVLLSAHTIRKIFSCMGRAITIAPSAACEHRNKSQDFVAIQAGAPASNRLYYPSRWYRAQKYVESPIRERHEDHP